MKTWVPVIIAAISAVGAIGEAIVASTAKTEATRLRDRESEVVQTLARALESHAESCR